VYCGHNITHDHGLMNNVFCIFLMLEVVIYPRTQFTPKEAFWRLLISCTVRLLNRGKILQKRLVSRVSVSP